MNDTPWNPIQEPLYPWVRTVERILREANPPAMTGPLINIFSDYSGDYKGSQYDVMSVLYADLYASPEWERCRRCVRKRFLADGRRLSFKKLGDRQRQNALVPFLSAANARVGINVTVAIRKSIQDLCSDKDAFDRISRALPLAKDWRQRTFERMLRVTHLISILIAGFARSHQNLYWISDEDMLFANARRTHDLKRILECYTNYYVRHPLGELGLGTTSIDPGDRFEEDTAAITDLVAGAVSEIVNKARILAGGRIPISGLVIPFGGELSPKTEIVRDWLADENRSLKRVVILIERGDDHTYGVAKFSVVHEC